MNLRELVEAYRKLAHGFGTPVALAAFGMPRERTEAVFGAFDEDYHISRYFHFTLEPGRQSSPELVYRINEIPQSHVSMDAGIVEIL